jgi:hypothetical protein
MIRERTRCTEWERRVLSLSILALTCFLLSAGQPASAQVLLVSPALDQNDRIAAILENASPAIQLSQVRLVGRPNQPDAWRRSSGERGPVQLDEIRLIILENAPASGLTEIPVFGAENLLEALPAFLHAGGHLLVVGGWPSFDTYPGTSLASLLPAEFADDPGAKNFQASKGRKLRGSGTKGLEIKHIHPIRKASGEVLIKAGGQAFAIRGPVGRGETTIVLGGTQEHYRRDAGEPESAFFRSEAWDQFLLQRVSRALTRTFEAAPQKDASILSGPSIRVGQSFRPSDWFKNATTGELDLLDPFGHKVFTLPLPAERFALANTLRPGQYEAVLRRNRSTERRPIQIGTAVDLRGFDIRLFALAHAPGPFGLAPGEAYHRARDLKELGFTSVVYYAYPKRVQNNLRTAQEILHAGLNIVYYQSIRSASHYPNRWPNKSAPPPVARNLDGEAIGWDLHSPAFRLEIGNLFNDQEEIVALPGIRAIQMIEEIKDGGRRSPSLRSILAARGLRRNLKPGDPDWLILEDIRSNATATTYQSFRQVGQRLFPGIPQSSYWPGSYWSRPNAYTHRVSALADAADELLGPGYGYGYGHLPGWLSVIRTTNEVFSAHNFDLSGSKAMAVYAQGSPLPLSTKSAPLLGINTWRETAWTALAHGATGIAYFDLPIGPATEDLKSLHDEILRVGPWLAKAPRQPTAAAILTSWSTRGAATAKDAKLHHSCAVQLHDTMILAVEEVEFVREEQLSSLPSHIKSIALTAAPILPDAVIRDLHDFVSRGGHLFVDNNSGLRKQDGNIRGDPWLPVRSTGRIHHIPLLEQCGLLGRVKMSRELFVARWRERLAEIGIKPFSASPDSLTEAKMLGHEELGFWVFLNHHPDPRSVTAQAQVPASQWLWRDLRTNKLVRPTPIPSGVAAASLVGGYDAVVWAGSKRPTAKLQVAAQIEWHQICVEVTALDKDQRPVPDFTPLRLTVRNQDGIEVLAPNLRSQSTLDGRAGWTIPITAGEHGGEWSIEANAPISGTRERGTFDIAPPEIHSGSNSVHGP